MHYRRFIAFIFICEIFYFTVYWWYSKSRQNVDLSSFWISKYNPTSQDSIMKLKDNVCEFPILNPYDKNMTDYVKFRPRNVDCVTQKQFYFKAVNYNNTPFIKAKSTLPSTLKCCYEHLRFSNVSEYKQVKYETDRCIFISQNQTELEEDSMYIVINCWSSDLKEIQFKTFLPQHKIKTKPTHQELLLFVAKLQKGKLATVQSRTNDQPGKLNVIVIAYDAVSRLHFIRKMKKSYKYLMKDLNAIDLQGFNKIGDNTLNNSLAFLTGYDYGGLQKTCWKSDEDYLDDCPWIWKNFSQAGYVTAYADDYDDVFSYRFKGFRKQPTDYYLHPFVHWYHSKKYLFGTYECLGNERLLHLMLDHTINLSGALRDYPYFQYVWQTRMSEIAGYFPLTDTPTIATLKHLNHNGLLNTSIVLLVSDHGWRTGEVMLHPQARLENRQSFSFIILPKWFQHLYPVAYQNLVENQYRLTTPYDIHSTMLDMINPEKKLTDGSIQRRTSAGEGNGSKVSLFLPISKQRTCQMAQIDDMWCACGNYKSFPVESEFATTLGEFAVATINSWLKPFNGCSQYTLQRVISVEFQPAARKQNATQSEMFRAVFSVNPKGAQFEVLIYDENGNHSTESLLRMSTEVFRLNRYSQSNCINVYSLKKLCTCKKVK